MPIYWINTPNLGNQRIEAEDEATANRIAQANEWQAKPGTLGTFTGAQAQQPGYVRPSDRPFTRAAAGDPMDDWEGNVQLNTYNIGGREIQAPTFEQAMRQAGALAGQPQISGEAARAADRADENRDIRAEGINAGRIPGQYDSGLPRVPAGMEAWMYDPRIKKPGQFPNTFGMDVADLASRAGVSESVAQKVVNDILPRLSAIAGVNEPDDYDNPDIYPQNLPGGFGRKSYAQWNLGSGDIWSNPSARNMFRYKSEGWVDRSDPTGARNKRPEEMTPGITEDEKKVYRTLHTGNPVETWTPPYPDAPHVQLPSGEWGPAPKAEDQQAPGVLASPLPDDPDGSKADGWFEPGTETNDPVVEHPPGSGNWVRQSTIGTTGTGAGQNVPPKGFLAPSGETGTGMPTELSPWEEYRLKMGPELAQQSAFQDYLGRISPGGLGGAFGNYLQNQFQDVQRTFNLGAAVTPGLAATGFSPYLQSLGAGDAPANITPDMLQRAGQLLSLGDEIANIDPTTIPGWASVTPEQWQQQLGALQTLRQDQKGQFLSAMQPTLRGMNPAFQQGYMNLANRRFLDLLGQEGPGSAEGFQFLPWLMGRGGQFFGPKDMEPVDFGLSENINTTLGGVPWPGANQYTASRSPEQEFLAEAAAGKHPRNRAFIGANTTIDDFENMVPSGQYQGFNVQTPKPMQQFSPQSMLSPDNPYGSRIGGSLISNVEAGDLGGMPGTWANNRLMLELARNQPTQRRSFGRNLGTDWQTTAGAPYQFWD